MKIRFVLFSLVIVVALALCCAASIPDDYVEISFKVGDSTLNINGEDVNVETPYVVGEGVTLVPVRVITEAFGATVEWDGAERKVTLTTEEKKIELWIGKTDATMNGEKLTLLSAPEISNNVTMVPLRFISEGFGADVSYDSKTKQIAIVKLPYEATKDGNYFYVSDDRSLFAVLPYLLNMNDDEKPSGTYVFGNGLRYDYSASTVIYSSTVKDDLEKNAESDRNKQELLISSENVTVTEVEKTVLNGIDVYYYQLVEEGFMIDKRVIATKSFFNHAQKSYLQLSFVASPEYDIKNEENLSPIVLDGYEISVPSSYADNVLDSNTVRPVSNGIERAEFRVFMATEDADIEKYLKCNQRVMSARFGTGYVENDISAAEYTFMDKKVSAYEYLLTGNGIKAREIIFEYDGYIILAEFVSNLGDDEINRILSNMHFDFDKIDAPVFENAETLKEIGENSTLVSVEDISFEVPESFEITYSSDNRFIIARDTESDLVLTCLVRSTVIDNDDTQTGMKPTYNLGMIETQVAKKTVSETMSDTEDNVRALLWENAGQTRRIYDSSDMAKTGTDCAKFKKTVFESSDFYMNVFQERTDDDLLEDIQRVHAFVFTYSSDSHTLDTMNKITSIMMSVKSN